MNLVDFLFEKTKGSKKLFLLGDEEKISYSELYKKVIELSKRISERNIKGQKIGIMSENSVFFMVRYLGVIHSGNIAVPIFPKMERNQLDYIVRKCNMKMAFVEEKYKSLASGLEIINELDFKFSEMKDEEDEDIAVINFTSGSTGFPKGVVLSHNNIIANTSSILKYLEITKNDIQMVVLPFYYCFGASLFHTFLREGGSLVINNKFILTNKLIENLLDYKCTFFSGVPSHYQILLRKSKFKETDFPNLRCLTQAGGKLANSFIKEIRDSKPGIRFFTMYGQTEATARLSYLSPELLDKKMGSIGKGIPGVELKVINGHGRRVVVGEIGEIVASGDNIMIGYYKDPDSTKNVLKNGELYTGDLATVDNEGYIYIHSRNKQIIKSAGNRISPKEIEETICGIPGVVDAIVFPFPDSLLGEVPKAVVSANSEISKEKIIYVCKSKLSSYKIPRYIEIVKSMPLTSSGKIDMNLIMKNYGGE